jgi:hypothetical protein
LDRQASRKRDYACVLLKASNRRLIEDAFDDRRRRLMKSQRGVSLSVIAFNRLQAGTLVAQPFSS